MAKHTIATTDTDALRTQLEEERARLAQLRFDLADRKLKKTSDIPATRRRIARILTALNKK